MATTAGDQYEVVDEDSIDEDEQLYQFTINIGVPNAPDGDQCLGTPAVEYDDTSDEEGTQRHKPKLSPKPKLSSKNDQPIIVPPVNTQSEVNDCVQMEESTEQDDAVPDEHTNEDSTVMDYAQTVSNIDWGSIAHIKHGTAGATADKDRFPFFNKTYKHWMHFLWDAEPHEWVLLFLEKKLEESEENFETLPATRRILLSDITEVYLELAPSTSFRIYLSADRVETHDDSAAAIDDSGTGEDIDLENGVPSIVSSADTTVRSVSTSATFGTMGLRGFNSAPLPTVLKITPVPSVRGHAAMWVDALYSAMQLQCHEPVEEVTDLRRVFYEAKQALAEEQEVQVLDDGGRDSSVVLGGSDESINGEAGRTTSSDIENGSSRDTRRPASARVAFEDIYTSSKSGKKRQTSNESGRSCCIVC